MEDRPEQHELSARRVRKKAYDGLPALRRMVWRRIMTHRTIRDRLCRELAVCLAVCLAVFLIAVLTQQACAPAHGADCPPGGT